MKKIKKIVFLTGTRADFGKLRPLIDMIQFSDKFESSVFVTGMHTLSKYGNTYQEVQKRGYQNVFVFMNQTHTTDQDTILANTIIGFGNFVKEISPDMIVVHGDRVEALAGVIVGNFCNILISHVEGGEISGTIDELIRHAVTKLSHVHFVSNKEAKQRLIQMGEFENRIFIIGSPDIEVMKSKELPSLDKVKNRYDIPFEDYAVAVFHPVLTEFNSIQHQISEFVSALIESKRNFVVIYPNNDKGSNIILDEYKRFENNSYFKIYPSLRFEYFLSLLKYSKFIVGNSSAGIREAEVYGVPAVDIGTRQMNRSKNSEIVHIKAKKKKILEAMNEIADKKVKRISHFGSIEKSSKKFYKILCEEKIWNISLQKQFIDLKTSKK